jgi:hypothetical protein
MMSQLRRSPCRTLAIRSESADVKVEDLATKHLEAEV